MSKKKENLEEKAFSQEEVYELLSGNAADVVVPEKRSNKQLWVNVLIVATVVTVAVAAFMGVGMLFENQHQKELAEAEKKEAKEGVTYFEAEEQVPEASETELTSVIARAYYTNDGSLAVYFCFANGMADDQRLNSVQVEVRNEKEEIIAAGFSDAIADDYIIKADGTANLLLYISPEYVKIANDPLSTISYDITTNYEKVK